ncbi:MAG: metallophosphoesterase [Actinobacteria bacterium]|nr:metallophosphoesterase [Actinomycetota bacterium]
MIDGLPATRWRWIPAFLLVPPLLTFGFPAARAQTTETADPTVIAAGDISMCQTTGDEDTAALIDSMPGTVLPLGDLAYQDGSKADFDNCYTPSWGRFRDRSRPVLGNHEYVQKGAGPYFDYWGPAAGDRTKGYYSFDVGAWHLIALNSNCADNGGCSKGSPMEQWLRDDLAAHPARCVMAMWHHPRFFSPSRQPTTSKIEAVDKKMAAYWADLYAAGVDVVLNGHRHVYERFARQDPNAKADPNGVRQFVVGTGGGPHDRFEGPTAPNSEVRKEGTYGVLQMTLHPEGFDWRFVATAGDPFTDAGSDTCTAAPPPPPSPPPA